MHNFKFGSNMLLCVIYNEWVIKCFIIYRHLSNLYFFPTSTSSDKRVIEVMMIINVNSDAL